MKYQVTLYKGFDTAGESAKDEVMLQESLLQPGQYKATWVSCLLEKQVYQAGRLQLTFNVVSDGNDDFYQVALKEFSQYKALQLHYLSAQNQRYDMVKTYVVLNCRRSIQPGSGATKTCTLVLTAYSPIKLLTVDKFNRAFTGRKFYEDMVQGYLAADKDFMQNNPSKALLAYRACHVDLQNSLNHLVYANQEKNYEVILPYTVQYNESIWDFLVRIASRNGEFLYYEDGKVQVGWPAKPAAVAFDLNNNEGKDNVYCFESMEDGQPWFEKDASTIFHANFLEQNPDELTDVGTLYNSECVVSPDVNAVVSPQDFNTISDNVDHIRQAITNVGLVLNDSTLLKGLTSGTMAAGVAYYRGNNTTVSNNEKYTNYYFAQSEDSDMPNEKDALFAEKRADDQNAFYQFASSLKLLNNAFYHGICKEAEKSRMHLKTFTFKTHVPVLLGETISYDGATYVVWSVDVALNTKGASQNAHVSEEYTVKVLPVVKIEQTAIFEAYGEKERNNLPEDKKESCIPMIDAAKRIVKAAPQRAVVVDNFDPEKLGRVRVRYPWQVVDKKDENKTYINSTLNDASPWIRVTTPMATNGAGILFVPNKGDEVMIDYEDGNIDRPYVNGSMYNKVNQPSYHACTQQSGKTKSIVSDNGHHLSFTDTAGDLRMVTKTIPFWNIISKLGVDNNFNVDIDQDVAKHTTGGFEIADYCGIYNISGSTESRSVSISSPLGKISMSAFTGISIEAPLGDISIVGKNVSIEAKNNLSIESGTNISKSAYDYQFEGFGKFFSNLGVTVGTGAFKKAAGVDLKLARCMIEALLKPIGGALEIKSNRYLSLVSGDGSASYTGDNLLYKHDMYTVDDLELKNQIGTYLADKEKLMRLTQMYNDLCRNVPIYDAKMENLNQMLKKLSTILVKKGDTCTVFTKRNQLCAKLKEYCNEANNHSYQHFEVFKLEQVKRSYISVYEFGLFLQSKVKEIMDLRTQNQSISGYYSNIQSALQTLAQKIDDTLESGECLGTIQGLEELTLEQVQQNVYQLIKNAFAQYVDMAATAPATFTEETLKPLITEKEETGRLQKLGKGVQQFLSSAFGLNGTIEDVSWQRQTKGGILLSNAENVAYTFKDGQYKPYTSKPFVRSLVRELTTINMN